MATNDPLSLDLSQQLDIPLANENTLLIKGINEKAVVFL